MPLPQIWKSIPPEKYFADLQIPDTWNTIEDFVDWYMNSKMPIMIPWDAKTTMTDDATAICLFRKPPYQIEMYIIHPNKTVQTHAHPGLDVITMILGGGKTTTKSVTGVSTSWGYISENLKQGETHAGQVRSRNNDGYVILSFEKWPDGVEMTSAAIRWTGKTAGPMHDALIQSHYPNALQEEGYADITK
jgi:hypothetical protein